MRDKNKKFKILLTFSLLPCAPWYAPMEAFINESIIPITHNIIVIIDIFFNTSTPLIAIIKP